jgi:hypothetical protein
VTTIKKGRRGFPLVKKLIGCFLKELKNYLTPENEKNHEISSTTLGPVFEDRTQITVLTQVQTTVILPTVTNDIIQS